MIDDGGGLVDADGNGDVVVDDNCCGGGRQSRRNARVAGDGDDFTVSSSGIKSLMKKCVTRCLESEEDFVKRSTLPKRPMVRISAKFRP